MSKLADYVLSLSPEEQLRFADVIAECREREIEVAKNADAAREAVRELDAKNQRVMESLRQLQDRVAALHLRVIPPRGGVN